MNINTYAHTHTHTHTHTYAKHMNLLKSRDAILDGTHPCTKKEAIFLAGLQCHIQHGKYDKTKHVPGFLNLLEYLPAEYISVRDIENSILKEHMKVEHLKPIEAMLSYIQLCQSLPTYGVTYFMVKRKLKGRLWMTPALIGVRKDSIMVLDISTKDVTCSWPLMTVQSWGFNNKIFSVVSLGVTNEQRWQREE